MTDVAKAIPQEYGGQKYRSRTEARWAHFFHITSTPVQYEPEGYQLDGDRYVPDFLLTHPHVFFEVKPGVPTRREARVARKLAAVTGRLVVIAHGNPSIDVTLWGYSPRGTDQQVFLVEENGSVCAWLRNDVGGPPRWAIPLAPNISCATAYGYQHLMLRSAGMLQFNQAEHERRGADRYVISRKVDWRKIVRDGERSVRRAP